MEEVNDVPWWNPYGWWAYLGWYPVLMLGVGLAGLVYFLDWISMGRQWGSGLLEWLEDL